MALKRGQRKDIMSSLTIFLAVLSTYLLSAVSAQNACTPSPCGTNTKCDVSSFISILDIVIYLTKVIKRK